jgi:hypothetical protein
MQTKNKFLKKAKKITAWSLLYFLLFSILNPFLNLGFISSTYAADWDVPLQVASGSLKLWLDSTTYDWESNTLYTDENCTTGSGATVSWTEVKCWKDKSGNGHNVSLPASRGAPQIITPSADFNNHTVLSFSKDDKD